jgi:CAAX protease family protein
MDSPETASRPEGQPPTASPSIGGPGTALLGLVLAIGAGILLGIPAVIVDNPSGGELSTGTNVAVQVATALGFLLVPMAIAARAGASSAGEALRWLGVRRFRPSAIKWMFAAMVAYLLFAMAYAALLGAPHQEDIAEGFGALPIQIVLIVFAAPISEEVCFRGMLYGGFRQRMRTVLAALASAVVFGALHALTGISAVPPLIAFGFVLALLCEKTGSIVPGIILHMLNNATALIGQ